MAVRVKPAPVRGKKNAGPPVKPEPKLAQGKIGEGGTIGRLIDELQQLREKKTKANAALDLAIAAYTEQEAIVLQALSRQQLAGARGKAYQANIGSHVVPNVVDWPKVYAWVIKNKDMSLLHRRISATHWTELLDAKKPVPGITPVTLTVLSLTKVKK